MLRSRLCLLAAAVLWSTAGAAVKLSSLSAWQIASGRSLVAALVLALAFPAGRKLPSRRGLAAALAYAVTVVSFIIANKLTTSANAIFLQDTAPLYVLLLSPLLLRERPSRGELAAVPVFLLGLSLFFLDQLAPGQFWGNVIALGSGVAFAMAILGLRAVGEEGSSVLVWGNLIAGFSVLVPALGGPSPTTLDVGLILFLGVFQLGLAYTLFHRGLRETPAVEASLLILLEPVLNPVWTFLLAGERPGPWALVGGAIILLATAWRTLLGSGGSAETPAREPQG
ncbi:threonine/homoserine efflux transporter RhtA [Archangium gephyra]|uniref:Membrane protein n=1 Tax=Archangium gephyra TaxID=48 RepID=A0AAC8TK94_9BACT|nr:EamA family transporter [Archangium gephyra]AKJ07771.1 membrane protein [Archangium gephyra]REG29524.1 threonine/homoserine efflux transporter RhtA [Archangium gephyra]